MTSQHVFEIGSYRVSQKSTFTAGCSPAFCAALSIYLSTYLHTQKMSIGDMRFHAFTVRLPGEDGGGGGFDCDVWDCNRALSDYIIITRPCCQTDSDSNMRRVIMTALGTYCQLRNMAPAAGQRHTSLCHHMLVLIVVYTAPLRPPGFPLNFMFIIQALCCHTCLHAVYYSMIQ